MFSTVPVGTWGSQHPVRGWSDCRVTSTITGSNSRALKRQQQTTTDSEIRDF